MVRSARRNVIAVDISAFVFGVGLLLISGFKTQVALAADAACPTSLLLETTNDHDYIAVFASPTPVSTGVEITLYTQTGSYELARSSVTIATSSGTDGSSFRSGPLLVADPSTEPFIAAAIRFIPDGRVKSCEPMHVIISSAERQKKRRFDNADIDLRKAVAKEANASTTEIAPENVARANAPSCANPFSYVSLEHPVQPDYPVTAQLVGATGTAQAEVTLDVDGRVTDASLFKSSGNAALDDATLTAARRSKYRSGSFLCKSEGGTYIFEADFSGHS